ncbi:hypothetical protein CGLO_13624 [Colletotrichum gloeosporioides Cg-14]|uniref:Uncharacterized protein n=1 Tax=Colletotrichum gloeosporioides (strain Cg-14) TaxID=1237896 RepID=T0JW78_COLGC|nr:hypothetical protein CGLO_13624 [Colletotrichum gloeosporioides Cg-14]
MKIEGEEQ